MTRRLYAVFAAACLASGSGSEASPAPQVGSVVQWGTYVVPYVEPGTRFKAIASGFEYTFLAVREDGTVIAWGQNSYGEATVPLGLSNVVTVAEATHSVALKSDGTVAVWGDNHDGQLALPAGLSNLVAISAAVGGHTLALRSDGTVAAWGDNACNQSTVPPGLSNVVGIAAGECLSVALESDGSVFDIGHGTNMVGPTNIVSVVASGTSRADPVAIRADGTVFDLRQVYTNLSLLSNVVAFSHLEAPGPWLSRLTAALFVGMVGQ
jgi:alpha-tubulin suppressor-like RCC1 family protein